MVPTGNARDLHRFLEVGKDFSSWMKDRINQDSFVEGVDCGVAFGPLSIVQKGYGNRSVCHLYVRAAKRLGVLRQFARVCV